MNTELNFEAAPFEFQNLAPEQSGFEFEEESDGAGIRGRAPTVLRRELHGRWPGKRPRPPSRNRSLLGPRSRTFRRIRAGRPGARPEPMALRLSLFRSNLPLILRSPRRLLRNTCGGCRAR